MQRDLRAHGAGAEHGDGVDGHAVTPMLVARGADAVDEEIDDGVGLRGQRIAAPAEHPVGGHLVEGAEKHLGRDRRVDVLAELPGRLAVGERVADQAEVVAQVRRRELLHELGRLAQFDLKDDGEIAIAAEALEMQPRDAGQALARIGDALERRAPFGDRLAHRPLEQRHEQVVLAAEVEIDRAGGDAGGASHVGDLRLEEPVAGKDVRGGLENGFALVDEPGGGDGGRRVLRAATAYE